MTNAIALLCWAGASSQQRTSCSPRDRSGYFHFRPKALNGVFLHLEQLWFLPWNYRFFAGLAVDAYIGANGFKHHL